MLLYGQMWENTLKGNLVWQTRKGAQRDTGHMPSISIVQPNAIDLPQTTPKFKLN